MKDEHRKGKMGQISTGYIEKVRGVLSEGKARREGLGRHSHPGADYPG